MHAKFDQLTWLTLVMSTIVFIIWNVVTDGKYMTVTMKYELVCKWIASRQAMWDPEGLSTFMRTVFIDLGMSNE